MPNYKRFYLKDYNYTFITIVTQNRNAILINNIELLRYAFKRTLQTYNFQIFAICILPDHLHMIIKEDDVKNYSKIVGNIKKHFSYNYNLENRRQNITKSMQKRKESGIFQRRFYEHIIRNEKDLFNHVDYIHYNSYKHQLISPKDWKYSTFAKFVEKGYYEENWCDFNLEMELE